jgi:hypothetical protein
MCKLSIPFLLFCALVLPGSVLAENKAALPTWLEVSVPMELENDYDFKSDTSGNERNNLFVSIEPEATINILPIPGLSIYAHGVLEQVVDAAPSENRFFKDHGFFVEDFFLRFEKDQFIFRGGKTNPGFGIAWDQAPGIYGTDTAEEYEMSERIVLSGTVNADLKKYGQHALTAGTFFLDTSPLQNTIYSQSRGTLDRSDGGVSNTNDFSSFNVTLEGGEFPAAPALQYHLAFIHQANGVDGTEDETGYAAAVTNRFKLGDDAGITPLFEFVRLENAEGTRNKEISYWTLSFLNEWRKWNLALAATHRRTTEPGAVRTSDYQFQVSAGYAFDCGLIPTSIE